MKLLDNLHYKEALQCKIYSPWHIHVQGALNYATFCKQDESDIRYTMYTTGIFTQALVEMDNI